MTFEELKNYCKPTGVTGPEPDEIGMLTHDSREAGKGSVFIAIEGLQADGHLYIEDAVANGASVVICEDASHSVEDACTLEVADTRALLGPLAQAFHGFPAEELKVIGITGTNGKTTVATLTYQLLMELGGARPSLLGTVAKRIYNEELDSLLTTADPIELARDMKKMTEAGSTHLVMEVSSHAIDQQRVEGIHFEVAAFTNLSHDHLDYHGSLEEYARVKKKLFDDLYPDAWAVINQDDEQGKYIALDCPARIIDFSFERELTYACEIISNTPEGLTLKIGGVEFSSSLVGTFNAYNVAEAVLICRALGYEFTTISRALESASGAAGRLERVTHTPDTTGPTVLVDYAHTPDALENVLSTLNSLKETDQELWVVFGCGGNRDKAKRPAMAEVAEKYGDRLIVTSDNPRNEHPEDIIEDIMRGFHNTEGVLRIPDRREAIGRAILECDDRAMVLIAGKGHETYQEVGGERLPFDDREVAREALGNRNRNQNGEVT